MKAVKAILADKSFSLPSVLARSALSTAEKFMQWIPSNKEKASKIEKELTELMCVCFRRKRKKQAKYRELMWSTYHSLRTSSEYLDLWRRVSKEVTCMDPCPTFYQNVGHFIFKELIKIHHPITPKDPETQTRSPPPLTYRETNALRYASGYIPRLLRKKLKKSTHKLKEDLKLCIFDLLDDGDENMDSSKDWIKAIDRGGLTHVNNATFDVFFAIEHEIRSRLFDRSVPPDLSDRVKKEIIGSEEVQFFWSMVSAEWEEESGDALLEMIVNQYVKIRGFSSASDWLEEYKQVTKKTTQKSKGVRKQLIPTTLDASKAMNGDNIDTTSDISKAIIEENGDNSDT